MLSGFDRVVVTASNAAQCELFKHELERRKGRYFSDSCIVQAIADPLGWRIGSGGATFQAIAEAYDGSNLLILHSGGDSRRNPLCTVSGKAFAEVNLDPATTTSDTPLDRLLEQLSSLLPLRGVLIAATDTLMTHFEVDDRAEYQNAFFSTAVTGVGIYAPWEFGTRHGVFYEASNDANNKSCFGILQKASENELRQKNAIDAFGDVLLDSGIVFLGESVAKSIQELIKSPPFIGLSAKGLDSGLAQPIRFELYTDVFGSLKDVCSKEDFLNESSNVQEREIRTVLLQALGFFDLRVLKLAKKCRFIHVGTTREHRDLLVMKESYEGLTLTSRKKSFLGGLGKVASNATLINSHISGNSHSCQIQDFAVVEHCMLKGFFNIGPGAFVSNVESDGLHVPDNIVIQHLSIDPIKLQNRFKADLQESPALRKILSAGSGKGDIYILSIFGVDDAIKDVFPKSKFCNEAWGEMASLADVIWPNANIERSLWTARLFPVLIRGESQDHATWFMHRSNGAPDEMNLARWRSAFRVSLSDLCWIADMDRLVHWKYEQLPDQIILDRLIQAICSRTAYPSDCYPMALPDSKNEHSAKRKTRLLRGLDDTCGSFSDESLCARTLSLIGDLLAGQRQPRSGDSSHPDFATPIMDLSRSKLHSTKRIQALKALADVRDSSYWSDSHDAMMRAARHYDAASQALTARCLFVGDFQFLIAKETVSEGVWIHSTAPARIDLSGGWSDTPPITNESGGAVCNVAVNLKKDVHCLGASARKISSLTRRTQFVFRLGHHDETPSSAVICTEPSDFDNHSNPKAPGALAKCVLLAISSVDDLFSKNVSVELCMWSDLPAGSGLGGSSILAACALSAVSRVLGLALSKEDLVRGVLKVEQLLSSGGGWQDQIGAIFPMFKIGVSPATLPINVDVSTISVPTSFVNEFEARTLLIQTGPARLARDLLQNVVRRWHRRDAEFTSAIQNLRENSGRMKTALVTGDIDAVCRELNVFWDLKKFVAGAEQAEPDYVGRLFQLVAPYIQARSLCGAGGGGFAVMVLTSSANEAEVRKMIKENFPGMQVHNVHLCASGLRCWMEGESQKDLML